MRALVTPLFLTVILYAPTASAITWPGLPLIAAGIAALEAGLQGLAQVNSTYDWATAHTLNPSQAGQVQQAIDYLRDHGFTKEAAQAQGILISKHPFSTTFVSRPGKSADMALTSSGPISTLLGSGHITLYNNFFTTGRHDGLPIDTPDKRTRDQAATILHELVHLNTQANSQHIQTLSGFTDWELGPLTTQINALSALGYTRDEIETIRQTWARGPYKKYVGLIDKALANIPASTTTASTSQGTNAGPPPSTTTPGAPVLGPSAYQSVPSSPSAPPPSPSTPSSSARPPSPPVRTLTDEVKTGFPPPQFYMAQEKPKRIVIRHRQDLIWQITLELEKRDEEGLLHYKGTAFDGAAAEATLDLLPTGDFSMTLSQPSKSSGTWRYTGTWSGNTADGRYKAPTGFGPENTFKAEW